jgi:hypothetical protein
MSVPNVIGRNPNFGIFFIMSGTAQIFSVIPMQREAPLHRTASATYNGKIYVVSGYTASWSASLLTEFYQYIKNNGSSEGDMNNSLKTTMQLLLVSVQILLFMISGERKRLLNL